MATRKKPAARPLSSFDDLDAAGIGAGWQPMVQEQEVAPPAPEQDGPMARGVKQVSASVGLAGRLAARDFDGAAQNISDQAAYRAANPGSEEAQGLMRAWQQGDGIWGGIKGVAGEIADDYRRADGVGAGVMSVGRNLQAMGSGLVEQVPNMALPMAGMIGGGAAGSAAGPVGTVAGGWAGASAGNALVGTSEAAFRQLEKAGVNPSDAAAVREYLANNGGAILGETAIKGGVIGAVDVATAGLAHWLLSGPGKMATTKALTEMGVDMADKAAVKAATKTPAFKNLIANDATYQATQVGAQKLLRNTGAAATEPVGEFAGEYGGSLAATGEADAKDAFLEAASSLGQSGIMFAGQKAIQAIKSPSQAAADTIRANEKLPESGALTKAVNAGVEAKAQAVEAGAPLLADDMAQSAPDSVDDPVRDRILALPDGARQDALRAYAVVNRTDVAKGVVQYNRKLLDRLLTENQPALVLGERLTDTDMGAMLGGGGMMGNADPLMGALGMNREAQANSITNVARAAQNRPPMPASDAVRMLDEARNQGVDLVAAEHPAGGFVLVPPQWVTPEVAAQGEQRLNETIARMQQADAAPVERVPRTSTAPVDLNLQTDPVQNFIGTLRTVNTPAARAYVRDFDAGRITPANVQQRMVTEQGKTPDQRIAQAAAEAPATADPVADRLRSAAAQAATVTPTDILNPSGLPFKTKMAADLAAKKSPGAAVLPVVDGGFLVRPKESVSVQDVPQAPEVPQAAPAISQPGQAPQAVGTQPASPAAGVPAAGAGAVEAAGVEATTGAAIAPSLFSDPRTGTPVVVPNKATADNQRRRAAGERTIGGDSLHDTIEQAKAAAEREAKRDAEQRAAKAEAARQRAADAQAARDEERKRIAQASVRAADRFELGQDPLDSLTGQGSVFDDAPEQPASRTPEIRYELPPEKSAQQQGDESWMAAQSPRFKPTARQQLLMDAVAKALDDGAFRSRDLEDRVAQTLGVTPEQRARNSHNVEGGDFGYDVYGARKAVEAQRGSAKSREFSDALSLKPGDALGTLVFNDGKVTTGVKVVSLNESGLIATITGKRGAATLNGEVGVDAIASAMDRAKERGKRSDGYAEFVESKVAPIDAAQQAPAATEPVAQPITRADVTADGTYAKAVEFVRSSGDVKRPAIQDALGISFAEVNAILDRMEREGVVTAAKSNGARSLAEPAKAAAPAAPISDFGEKIGGARKDVWSGFKDDLNKVLDDDIAGQPLAKVWPAPDYQKLIDAGMNAKAVAAVRALRDEVPAKPRAAWKVKRWAEQVKTLRSLANDVMDGKITVQDMERMGANKGTSLRGMMGRIELYELVGHEKSLEGVRFAHHHYTLYKGRENVSLWVVEKDAGASAFSNWPREIATGDTKEQALAAFKEKYAGLDLEKAVRKASFDIFSERGSNAFYVGKKIGRNYAKLEGPFNTVREAREYREKNLSALEAKLEKYKEIPRERADVNQPRVGVDMRNGQDVTPQMFGEVFGFRGVEFGNWVEQKRRQKDLNDAFDALMDMAAVLDIPPKAISLNGKLGLAFGARGSGGVNPAAAHYEPDSVVINLTKKEGAGSLGHEWWHALDNYFAKQRATNRGSYMTTGTDVGLAARGRDYFYEGGVRQEMIEAFGAVVKAINQTAMKARASKLDGKRTKDYWTTGEEMSARAFESYLISKLQDQNASNDYLANVVSEKTWDAMAALGMENENSYPYPTAAEIPAIRAGFDHFFQTVETKEGDTGNVVMFSRAQPAISSAAAATPAATIRAAIAKAYGKLLGQLESKGLVTLTQTQEQAIEAAARARADKTGQPLAEVRASLMGSVSNSVATDTPAFKRWFAGSKVVDADGKPLVVYHGTNQSFSIFDREQSREGDGVVFATPNRRVASDFAKYRTTWGGANVMPVYVKAEMVLEVHGNGRNIRDVERDTKFDGMKYGEDVRSYAARMGYDAIVFRQVRDPVSPDIDPVDDVYALLPSAQIKSAIGNNGNFDPNDLDIRRSANGAIQGFFDPQTGQSFLIADNLTAEAAPGVLMHEVGIHMAADGSMKAMFNRAAMMLKMQRGNPFMKAVQARMDAAGETSGEEAAAYIAEAYENDRANAPASVQRWLTDLLAAVKAWMFKKGIMGADRLTVADIAAVARANARSMARGDGATGGQGFGPAFSVGEEVGAKALAEFAKADELFALPKSSKDTVKGIAADNDPLIKVSDPKNIAGRIEYTLTMPDDTEATLSVREPNPYGDAVYDMISTDEGMEAVVGRPGENPDDVPPTGDVWINVADFTKGEYGAAMYNIAATYAHNTGRIFIGDPYGLSKVALHRRLEQMISSALKFGTTAHLAPHPDQTRGGDGVPPLRWVYGDHVGNVERMIAASVKALDNGFPQSKMIEYRDDGNFYNAKSGKLLPRGRLAYGLARSIREIRGQDRGDGSTGQAGWRTVARAVLFRYLQSKSAIGSDGVPERGSLLDLASTARAGLRSDGSAGTIGSTEERKTRIFYSRTADAGSVDEGAGARIGAAIKSVTVTNIKQRAGFKLTDYLGIGLQALGRRQIVDIYGDMLPLGEYNRLVQQMEADKNEGSSEADQLVKRWAKLEDEGKLADLMHDATLAQIDPDKPHVDGDDKAAHMMLQGRFKALSDEAKAVYRATRDAYRAHHAKVRSAIKDRIERSEIKGERKAALLKQMDDEFFKAIKGVYFPLARFGQYAVTVKGPDGKVESVSRAETKAEAEALRSNLLSAFPRDKGFTVGRVMLSKDFIADRDAVGRGFMTELYQVLDQQNMDAAQRAELEDTLGQLYLSSLPDLSWAKHGIHRKGTPGFSQDARRAFAQNMFHGARYLAKLRYSDLMQDELTAMQRHVDDWREVEDFDQNSAQRVVDEMNKRHESLMNPTSNPLSTALTSLGFVFHLGLSPASAMVNLSQTALVAYPIMGAKWGFNKASAALLKASKQAAAGKNDITGSLNADERAAYDEAVRAGTIDVTMAHDLAGIAQGEDAGVMWKIRPVMRWASFLFHHAERFNRQVTFVASYRLAREAGADQKAAFEQATKATYDGHFDYGAANRPRVMQGNVAKVLLLFKQYGQNMVYTLSRSAYQSIKGTDAEKAEARKVLAGLLTSHAMAAGVLGLPMVTTLLAAASMIGGDEDEPWDAQTALQNMLADAFGQKPAEVLAHGLSRLTPWDISGRVGLDRLIFPDVQEGLEGQRLAESAMAAALGPVAGIGVNVLKGAQHMSEGRFGLGLEAMLPSALRGLVKAIRYANDGVQDKSGISILDEVGHAAVAGQALGFSPSEARNAQEGKSAVMAHDRALGERRQELLTKAARATMDKDTEARAEAMKEIERFNKKNPKLRITPLNVLQSVRNSQRRIDQAEGGVYLPKNRRDAMEAGRFALAESE